MRNPRSYVVNVYRRQAGITAGTVQDVSTGRRVPFQSMEELWQAIDNEPPHAARNRPRGTNGHREGIQPPDEEERKS